MTDQTEEMIKIYFRKSLFKEVINRSFDKFMDYLAFIGGIMKVNSRFLIFIG